MGGCLASPLLHLATAHIRWPAPGRDWPTAHRNPRRPSGKTCYSLRAVLNWLRKFSPHPRSLYFIPKNEAGRSTILNSDPPPLLNPLGGIAPLWAWMSKASKMIAQYTPHSFGMKAIIFGTLEVLVLPRHRRGCTEAHPPWP